MQAHMLKLQDIFVEMLDTAKETAPNDQTYLNFAKYTQLTMNQLKQHAIALDPNFRQKDANERFQQLANETINILASHQILPDDDDDNNNNDSPYHIIARSLQLPQSQASTPPHLPHARGLVHARGGAPNPNRNRFVMRRQETVTIDLTTTPDTSPQQSPLHHPQPPPPKKRKRTNLDHLARNLFQEDTNDQQ